MTVSEAISVIECARAEVEWDYPLDYAIAFDMAIEALKKQDGVKPKYKLESCGRNYELENVAHCPVCGSEYEKYHTYTGYCVDCGQKIDDGGGKEYDTSV